MSQKLKSILIIEDDAAILQTLKDTLEISGYHVITAENGLVGIEKLLSMEAPPLVILLDLVMPVMNGWGFLDFKNGSKSYSEIPVILCSAYESSARAINEHGVLVKPIHLDDLLTAIQAVAA